MQPSPPRGPGLGALLLAFVAGAIGGVAGALLVQPLATPAGAEDPALRQAIAALDETVRGLGSQLAGLRTLPAPAGRPPAEPLTAPPGEPVTGADLSSVVAQLEAVAKLLQSHAAASAGFAGAAPVSPLDTTQLSPDHSALAALATENNDERQLWHRHAFWTCRQVLEAYGVPEQVEAGDGSMSWYYRVDDRVLHFVFYEGMLVELWN